MAERGKDLSRSSWKMFTLQQAYLEQAAQHHVLMASEYIQGWRLYHLPGQPVLVLSHLHSTKVPPDHRLTESHRG